MTTEDDFFAPVPEPDAVASNGVVLCEFNGLTVAIPQQDVLTIEHGSQLAAPLGGEKVIGWFESDRGPWPVYALDRMLELADDAQLQRAFLVFLKTESLPIGLLCESVRILGKVEELRAQPLPQPLRGHAPSNTGIAALPDKRIALVFGAGTFGEHIRKLDNSGGIVGDTVMDATVRYDVRNWRQALQAEAKPAESAVVTTKKTESVRAWLLDWATQPLALALCEVIEVVNEPQIHVLPFGPSWCRAVLVWRDTFLALAGEHAAEREHAHIVVTAYQSRAGEALQYAAFAIEQNPRQITVSDGLDCDPPAGVFNGPQLRASFEFENRTVVVPELSALFGSEALRA